MSAIAYRRAPLVDPAYAPLSDAAVHASGLLEKLTKRALEWVDVNRMSALDAILATKLGGYTQAPPMPDVVAAASALPQETERFVNAARAGFLIASMNRDKDAMLRVLAGLRAFGETLPAMSEAQLFGVGADVLRLAVDCYRRTGQRFLLKLLEDLRSRLPDVSGVMHMFPFQHEFQPETGAHQPQDQEYYDRMQRLATGKLTADAVSMTTLLAQYSGSGRDATAAKAGFAALTRYHGMPAGTFSADPYLAGRDPARAVELPAVSAQAEACLDALLMSGDGAMADRLEMILQNVMPELMTDKGLRALAPTNRLPLDDSCDATKAPAAEDVTALLRLLYAVRRSLWLSRDDDTVAYMLPVNSGCMTRLGSVHVRLSAETAGVFSRETRIRVECREPAQGTVRVRVPSYAQNATIRVNADAGQTVAAGGMVDVKRVFRSGDVICQRYDVQPRMENGYRGSASVYVGAQLMALALPNSDAEWRYAVLRSQPMRPVEEGGEPRVLITACEAPGWKEKAGFMLPPPQDVAMGPAYELTLIPFAGTDGRVAAYPCVRERG